MAIYTYQPLDLDRPAVRFVRLLAGYPADTIRCEMFQGWIDDGESGMPYNALSYTWGSIMKTARIEVDGSTMQVTSNLDLALRYLRFRDEDRILWIDAICIDQDNMKERMHQVQQMGEIYKRAQCVVVWLGEGTEESDLAMDAMKLLENLTLLVPGDWRHAAVGWMLNIPAWGRLDIEKQNDRIYKGIKFMLGLPWFKRIWILQEIANARTATIHCGHKSISAKIFAQVPSLIGLKPEAYCQAILDIMPGFSRSESWWKQNRNLHTLLLRFQNCEATDQRDMVYALIGISSDACKSDFLLPDYTKYDRQVVQTTVSYLLVPTNRNPSLFAFLNWDISKFFRNLSSESTELQNTVLRHASMRGQMAVVRLLLNHNADPASTDSSGRTALFFACTYGHKEAVELLLSDDAITERKDMNDRTPLFFAVSNRHLDIVKFLLEKGSNPNAKDNNGETSLFFATHNGHVAMVRLLLAYDAKLDFKNKQGHTAYNILEQQLSLAKHDWFRQVTPQRSRPYSKRREIYLAREELSVSKNIFKGKGKRASEIQAIVESNKIVQDLEMCRIELLMQG